MLALYLFSVWLHILAATVWIGGMFFLVLVVVPWLHQGDRANAGAFLRETGERFRSVGWICFGIALATGSFNLWMRGVHVSDLSDPSWFTSPFGTTVVLKIGVFVVVLLVSGIHDFIVGPEATRAMMEDPRSMKAAVLRHRASLFGRVNVLLALALVLVALGVMIVRGLPW